MASQQHIDLIPLERQLANLAIALANKDDEGIWESVEDTAMQIANSLRTKAGPIDHHTILGKTELPQTLKALLGLALQETYPPAEKRTTLINEILRVGANLCMDHDENRGALLEAAFPQAVVTLLEGYAEDIKATSSDPLPLTLPHLKIIRTSIGVLLNATLGYEPVKTRLNSLETALTLIKLSASIYPSNAWAKVTTLTDDTSQEWQVRIGISNWAWRTISALRESPDESVQILTSDILPWITPALLTFCPSHSPQSSQAIEANFDLCDQLVATDLDFLEETCTLIESLSLDVEDFRQELVRRQCRAGDQQVPCISAVLDFIEFGSYPDSWSNPIYDADRKAKEKAFDICKAALIKAVVEAYGEANNEEVLWNGKDQSNPGGRYVSRMVDWINQYNDAYRAGTQSSLLRDDMAICGTLSLGNLCRKVDVATTLLSAPYSLATTLASESFLGRSVDIKLKHGVLGLLKHIASFSKLSPLVPATLGSVNIVPVIVASGILDEKSDVMAEIVQLSAIGVTKHLCNANLDHTIATVLRVDGNQSSALSLILALVKRSASVPIKSEGSRVLVNVVKSLWFNEREPGTLSDIRQKAREKAISVILNQDTVSILAGLVASSPRFPILVNEGTVAMSLLCTHKIGGPLVLDGLTQVVTPKAPEDPVEGVTPGSPKIDGLPAPKHALDMLIGVLRNVDNPVNFPIEVRMNACTFFLQLQRHNTREALSHIQENVEPILKRLADDKQGDERLSKAAGAVLEGWKQA